MSCVPQLQVIDIASKPFLCRKLMCSMLLCLKATLMISIDSLFGRGVGGKGAAAKVER